MPTVADLTLPEAVALVGAFDPVTGKGIQPGVFSTGNIFLAESAALLIALVDDGCVDFEWAKSSQLVPGAGTTRPVAGGPEPKHPLLLGAYRTVVKHAAQEGGEQGSTRQGKTLSTDLLLARIATAPIHDRLFSSGLVARTGRLVKREALTADGLRLRRELCAEIDDFTASEVETDAAAVSERTALIVAILVVGLVAQPLYPSREREATIAAEARLTLLRERVSATGEHAFGRATVLAALGLANAGFIT
ncbi:hypothetical protein FB562_0626 [Homoserinimonas aerilata]|uniref:Golgi phosphoprotein 3 GPP34 n=1 Tax=Homoserinimonas aerilata TaxID=1162970 RepID=A0A542YHR2_9MICO|nr:hypothetical protein [Homoserinimonas aerilata]TQL47561.1 hypothetical protein FB562_0626 [Homoserinimonas aerilata]